MSNQMTPVGVPSELVFNLPASMLDSRKIEQRIQPYNTNRYTSSGQVAKFVIPQTDRTLASGQTMYITGKIGISGIDNGNTCALLGSYYSIFSRQVVNANGTVLETIERPGELINMLVNLTYNSSEKYAQQSSLGTGRATNGTGSVNIGGDLFVGTAQTAAGTATIYKTFSIPVIGIFDANKYVPMWNSDINIEMTTNAISNYLQSVTDTKATPNATFVISDLELVFDSIELSPESFSMVMANYPQKVVIKTSTYTSGYTNSFTGSGGQDLAISSRLSSLKALYCYFNQASLSDKTFGGINPNGQDIVFITNGQYYPQRPIKLNNPSEVYMQQQKAFGSIKSYSHSGSASKNNLCRRSDVDSDGLYNAPVNDPATLSDLLIESNQFYLAIDTEIINTNKDSLYNGIQTGVNSNIRLNIQNALTTSTTCYYWCYYDALIEMDFTTGITRAIY